jgi:hypothetical protein
MYVESWGSSPEGSGVVGEDSAGLADVVSEEIVNVVVPGHYIDEEMCVCVR